MSSIYKIMTTHCWMLLEMFGKSHGNHIYIHITYVLLRILIYQLSGGRDNASVGKLHLRA
jgi:hypothetical protein